MWVTYRTKTAADKTVAIQTSRGSVGLFMSAPARVAAVCRKDLFKKFFVIVLVPACPIKLSSPSSQ